MGNKPLVPADPEGWEYFIDSGGDRDLGKQIDLTDPGFEALQSEGCQPPRAIRASPDLDINRTRDPLSLARRIPPDDEEREARLAVVTRTLVEPCLRDFEANVLHVAEAPDERFEVVPEPVSVHPLNRRVDGPVPAVNPPEQRFRSWRVLGQRRCLDPVSEIGFDGFEILFPYGDGQRKQVVGQGLALVLVAFQLTPVKVAVLCPPTRSDDDSGKNEDRSQPTAQGQEMETKHREPTSTCGPPGTLRRDRLGVPCGARAPARHRSTEAFSHGPHAAPFPGRPGAGRRARLAQEPTGPFFGPDEVTAQDRRKRWGVYRALVSFPPKVRRVDDQVRVPNTPSTIGTVTNQRRRHAI